MTTPNNDATNPVHDPEQPNSIPPPTNPNDVISHLDNMSHTALAVRLVPIDESSPDAAATRQLLQLTVTPEGYKCPRCQKLFDNVPDMQAHLVDEINDSMRQLHHIYSQRNPNVRSLKRD